MNNIERINSGKKPQKLKKEKTLDKAKDSKETYLKISNKNSLAQNIINNNNKKGINLTDSSNPLLFRKLSEQKIIPKKILKIMSKKKKEKEYFRNL